MAYGPFDRPLSLGVPLTPDSVAAFGTVSPPTDLARIQGAIMSASTTGVRLTLKFNFGQLIRNAGWSESYDMGYGTLADAISNVNRINAFIRDRCNLLGIGPYCVSATLTAYTPPVPPNAAPGRRATLALTPPSIPAAGTAYNPAFIFTANGTFLADFAPTVLYISLQTSLSSTPVYRRNVWIAGLPDGSDQSNQGRVTEPFTNTALTVFLNDLNGTGGGGGASNNIAIRSINRSDGNAVKPCTAWNPAALPLPTYTVPAHGWQPGQPILAEGMKTVLGGYCPKGRYLVGTVPDANTITLQGAVAPSAPLKLGGFRAAIVVFNGVAIANPLGFTKRNKGRPFALSVGRQPRKTTKRA